MSEERCLFPGMQRRHGDSPAEVALSPVIPQHKTESGNLLQRQEHPSHEPLGSLQEPQDLLVQPHANTKCSCQELQGRDLSSACAHTSKCIFFNFG